MHECGLYVPLLAAAGMPSHLQVLQVRPGVHAAAGNRRLRQPLASRLVGVPVGGGQGREAFAASRVFSSAHRRARTSGVVGMGGQSGQAVHQ